MQISPPFLRITPHTSDESYINACMQATSGEGNFPLAGHFCWHNGIHLKGDLSSSNTQGTPSEPVCAIADGIVKFVQPPAAKNNAVDNPLNYNPFGEGAAWTDTGLVIIEHTFQLSTGGRPFKFYSAYMHLSKLDGQLPAAGSKIKRRAKLGVAGQIYGASAQIHLEICSDETNLQNLIGRAPGNTLTNPPTADGQTDWVFGSTLIYLPAGVPVCKDKPTTHIGSSTGAGPGSQASSGAQDENLPPQSTAAPGGTANLPAASDTVAGQPPGSTGSAGTRLEQPVWIEIAYERGECKITTFDASNFTSIGSVNEAKGEYKLFFEAAARHASVSKTERSDSTVGGWYQLLRFGRVLGTAKLPAHAQHWRQISTAKGEAWVDLNATGTYKFSEADFVPPLGWRFIQDDSNHGDQRCESAELKNLIINAKPSVKLDGVKTEEVPGLLMDRVHEDIGGLKRLLRRTICKFGTEWVKESIEERCGWMRDEPGFKENPENWQKLRAHLTALSCANLPAEYVGATWNWHPVEFMRLLRSFTVSKEVVTVWDDALNMHTLPDDSALTDMGKVALHEYCLRSSEAAVTSDQGAEVFTALEALDKTIKTIGVIVGLRKEAHINVNNGHGDYTDRVLILKRADGYVVELLHRGRYTSQPCGRYLDGGASAYGPHREGKTVTGYSHYLAIGRLKANQTYKYKLNFRDNFGDNLPTTSFNILKRESDTHVDRLVTPLNASPGGAQSVWKYGTNSQFLDGMSMYFHRGYTSETGSAGCQTFPTTAGDRFAEFMDKLKPYLVTTAYPYALISM